MTQEELKKLRVFYHSLVGTLEVLEYLGEKNQLITDETVVRPLAQEIQRIEADFPGLVPRFTPSSFVRPAHTHTTIYDVPAIRIYLSAAIARLKVELDDVDGTPVTETREFLFVKNAVLRKVLERDYQEIQRAYVGHCWKAVIILAGSAIEAILTDLLLGHQSRAKAATAAPKRPDITNWDLADLIKVSVELGLVSPGVEKLSHSVREYRNLVHPGNEIRNKLRFQHNRRP